MHLQNVRWEWGSVACTRWSSMLNYMLVSLGGLDISKEIIENSKRFADFCWDCLGDFDILDD